MSPTTVNQEGLAEATTLFVVVSFNSSATIERCLEAITACRGSSFIVVYDNCSADSSSDLCERALEEGQGKLIRGSENLGFGLAANRAVLEASSLCPSWNKLVLVNPDCYVEAAQVGFALSALDSSADIGLVGLEQLDTAGEIGRVVAPLPNLVTTAGALLRIVSGVRTERFRRRKGGARQGHFELLPVGRTEFCSGSLLVIARRAWEALDGFDQRFFMYCEDADLFRRAAELDWDRQVVVGGRRSIHEVGASGGSSYWNSVAALGAFREYHKSAGTAAPLSLARVLCKVLRLHPRRRVRERAAEGYQALVISLVDG